MAEVNKEKSAARLASLQKCAAAGRSAKRLDALRKCAAAGRSARRLEALRKCAESKTVKASADRSAIRRLALTKAAAAPAATFGEAAKRIAAQHVQNVAGAEKAVAAQTAGLKDTPGFSLQNFMNALKTRKAETVAGGKALAQTAQTAGKELAGTASVKFPKAYAYVKGFLGKIKPQTAAPVAK